MVLRLLTLRLPMVISFEDSAEHRQSVAWPSGDRDRVANSEQAERQAADEYREDTERNTSTASRCELLRGELIYDFELYVVKNHVSWFLAVDHIVLAAVWSLIGAVSRLSRHFVLLAIKRS